MIRQIRYFHSVVKNHSFSKAAVECHISQSAISQQIQSLERELGFQLFTRQNRSFELTKAGKYFYAKTLVLVADLDALIQQSKKLAEDENILKIGYLRSYNGNEFYLALEQFSQLYPDIHVQIEYGNHEELYRMLENGEVDIALNDQRRNFSNQYENVILTTTQMHIELSSNNVLADLKQVNVQDLKNFPCILISSDSQKQIEKEYYRDVIGYKGDFLYAQNLEEARMMVVANKGFMPIEGIPSHNVYSFVHIPLYNQNKKVIRNYCAFWKKDNANAFIPLFSEILRKQFGA